MMIKSKNKYINRELSWLQFNARVLQEANDESVPLMERIRFVGIFSNNLDEFFRVRYATIQRIIQAGKEGTSHLGGIPANQLLEEITQMVIEQQKESLKILNKIQSRLKKHNVFIINEHQIPVSQHKFVKEFFIQKIRPALMTIMLDEVKEFPLLRDSAAYLFIKITLQDTDTTFSEKETYALIELPRSIDRFVVLPTKGKRKYIILLDDLIRFNLAFHFNIFNYESFTAHMIKITRDAELDLETDLSKSFLEKVSASVKERRTGNPVRFVYDSTKDPKMLEF
jgi:polyphosphate kinase